MGLFGYDYTPPAACTPCDTYERPAEAGEPGSLIFCQPGLQDECKGYYNQRSAVVSDVCKKILNLECFTLDTIVGGIQTLKWGSYAYAGSVLLPPGVDIVGYYNAVGYGYWGCVDHDSYDGGPTGMVTTASGGSNGSKWDFWDYSWRIDAFRLSLMEGYSCDSKDGVVTEDSPPAPPASFENYSGQWKFVGQGVTVSQTAERSWSETSSNSKSTAFTAGLTLGFEFDTFADLKVNGQVSAQVSSAADKTLSQMKEGYNSVTCSSPVDCQNGNLYQFRINADLIEGEDRSAEYMFACSFVCMPSAWSGATVPRCPPKYCSNITGCQCCNGNYLDSGTPSCFGPSCNSNEVCTDDMNSTATSRSAEGTHT